MAITTALRKAHETLSMELESGIEQYKKNHRYDNASAICEAVHRFVYELRTVPEWSAQLDRRAMFIERGCGVGSPWKKVADKVLSLLPNTLKTNDPKESYLSKIGIGAHPVCGAFSTLVSALQFNYKR